MTDEEELLDGELLDDLLDDELLPEETLAPTGETEGNSPFTTATSTSKTPLPQ